MRLIPGKTLKYGSHTLLIIVASMVIIVALNFLFSRYHIRHDMTSIGVHSLSEQTMKVLEQVTSELTINIFCPTGQDTRIRKLTEMIHYQNPHVKISFYDPVREPVKANAMNMKAYMGLVAERDGRRYKVEYERNAFWQEKDVTNAILNVLRDENKIIYFTTGHGERGIDDEEREGFSKARDQLEGSAYNVETLVTVAIDSFPENAAGVVIAGATARFDSLELSALKHYMEKGGDCFLLLDPGDSTGFEKLVRRYGVIIGNDFVVEPAATARMAAIKNPVIPIVTRYSIPPKKPHPILEKHQNVMTAYPKVRSIKLSDRTGYDIEAENIIATSRMSWAETDLETLLGGEKAMANPDPGELKGPVPIAVASIRYFEDYSNYEDMKDNPMKARLVVIGDSDFATNGYFENPPGNGDLFLNTINWLAEEEELIAIRPKVYGVNPIRLTHRESKRMTYFNLAIYPTLVLIAGVVIWWRRK